MEFHPAFPIDLFISRPYSLCDGLRRQLSLPAGSCSLRESVRVQSKAQHLAAEDSCRPCGICPIFDVLPT